MATVLILSSQVARGYVGGSAARIALERLGHAAWLLPSVILSNHPGHALFAGEQVPAGRLRAMVEALDANGWLEEVDAVMTGYMPGTEHVSLAARTVEACRARNPDMLCLCDPILGDDPGGLYIDEAPACAIRDTLLPLADIATPNRFELEWLSGRRVADAGGALKAAQALGRAQLLATSVPGERDGTLANLLVEGKTAVQTTTPRQDAAPRGTGDFLAALFLGHRLNGTPAPDALARASAGLEAALERASGADELTLASGQDDWANAAPAAIKEIPV